MNMKWIVAAAVAGLFASQVSAQEKVGSVRDLSGTASALDSSGASRALAEGAAIFLNDRIATGQGSKVTIRFVDNSLVSQGENAEMVVNEYVYDPTEKNKNSAAFRLLKGAFRFITDQITKLNPEHFQVEANYGTIGIRGCELGFNVNSERDDVFVIGLSGKENILFNLKGGGANKTTTLLVHESGVAVTMSPLEGLTQRHFDPSQIDDLLGLTSPATVKKDEDSWGHGEHAADHSSRDSHDPLHTSNGADTAAKVNTVVAQVPPLNGSNAAQQKPDTSSSGTSSQAAKDPATTGSGGTTTGGGSGGGNGGDFQTVFGPKTEIAGGSGTDWKWGIWGRDITTTSPDGEQLVTTRHGTTTEGTFITADQQLAIATGANIYHLAGNGDAAAVVSYKDQSTLMLGSLSLYVNIGGSISPTWNGYLAVGQTAGPNLHFDANGPVAMDGSLQTAAINNYHLSAYGFELGLPPGNPSDMVHGHLVGPGTGAMPISGGVLDFQINHPNAPSVVGAGGADLH